MPIPGKGSKSLKEGICMKELNTNVWFYLLLTVMSFAGVCITVWLGGVFLVATFLFGAGTVFSVVSVFNLWQEKREGRRAIS